MTMEPITNFSEAKGEKSLYDKLFDFNNNIFYRMAIKKMVKENHPAIFVNKVDSKHKVYEICPKDAGISDDQWFLDVYETMRKIKNLFEVRYGHTKKTPEEVIAKLAERSEDNKIQRYESSLNGDDIILNEEPEAIEE